jgi:signal transduction histidine kinase
MASITPDLWQARETVATQAADAPQANPSFMERLSDDDRCALIGRVHREHHADNSVIFREQAPGDSLYIIESGRVAILKEEKEDQYTLLAYRGPGEIVGEIGVMGQRARSASVIAVQDTDLIRIEGADFRLLVNERPGISRAILDVLMDRLEAADRARASVVHEEQRLANRLAQMTSEAERVAELARLRQDTIDLIVHDLRNPLGVIQGCLEMLQASVSAEAQNAATSDMVDLASHCVQRLMSLIESMLETAQQESLDIRLAREQVNLPQVISSAAKDARVEAQQHHIELMLDAPPDLPPLTGDPARLERVMLNLLDNAVAYTPAGGKIVVRAVKQDDHIQVSVTDTGPGVPPEYRQHIFERFGRVPNTRGRRRGFGLGLYFCRQVIEAHGGRIWVEPGPDGAGSRFVFTLPSTSAGDAPVEPAPTQAVQD